MSSQISDEALVESCLAGDQSAWTALVARYKNLVYSVPVRYHMAQDDASDIFQQVWLALFSELPRLRNAGALRSWLLTVAAHKCSQLRRRQQLLPGADEGGLEDLQGQSGFEWQVQAEREQTFREAMEQIPPRCRDLVRMLFYEDPPLPYAEVAARLGLAEGSIGFIRGRCLQKVKRQLERMGF